MKSATLRSLAVALTVAVCAAQGREPIPPAPGEVLVGRVCLRDRTPVVGHPVKLMHGSRELASTVTDAEGRFELANESRLSLVKVVAQPTPDLRIVERSKLRSKKQRYEFVALPVAPFHGVAVDTLGQPLPYMDLRISEREGPNEVCATDRDGRFTTTASFSATHLQVHPVEFEPKGRPVGWSDDTRVAHTVPPSPTPVVCQLRYGPRYELDFVPAPGTRPADYVVHVRPSGLPPCAAGSQNARQASVQPGLPPWARPPAPRVYETSEERQTLHLLARNGLAGGSVELGAPAAAGPLRIAVEPLGALEIDMRLGEQRPPGTRAVSTYAGVHFTSLDGGLPFRVFVGAGRPETIGWIEPGRWRCDVTPPYFPSQTFEVLVPSAGTAKLTVTLGRQLPLGTMHIRVADPTGDVPGWTGLSDAPRLTAKVSSSVQGGEVFNVETASTCGTGVHAWFKTVEVEGRLVYEAVLENVPESDYVVRVNTDKPLVQVEQEAAIGDTVTFLYDAAALAQPYRFEVRAAGGGEPVKRYAVLSVGTTDTTFTRGARADGAHAYALPANDPAEWCVTSPGHRHVYGDRRDFVPSAPGHVARVLLEPGFAMRARATLADGSPAAGVGIVFDGRTFTTDLDGRLLLESPDVAPPMRVAGGAGWRIAGGDVDEAGDFSRSRSMLHLVIERAP